MDLAPTPANIKAAERLLGRVVGALLAGVYRREDYFAGAGRPSASWTFADYAEEWLKTLTVEKSTRRSYRTALAASWNPAFGPSLLGQVKPSDVRKAVAERARIVSGKTINNHLIVLRAVFAAALEDELIAVDPCARVKNQKHQTAEPDPLSADEKELILGRMQARYDERVFNYFDFAFHSGLRPSEQIALRWGDIDWRRGKAQISRAQVDYEEKGTKTNRVREIDLSDRATAALTRQKKHTFLKDPEGYVFENPHTGRPWAGVQVQLRSFWNPALRDLKLRHRDAYQTRHTFATLLLMGGVAPAYISKQLGHANTGMLFKVYGRWIEGADKGAEAAKANALMARKTEHLQRQEPNK